MKSLPDIIAANAELRGRIPKPEEIPVDDTVAQIRQHLAHQDAELEALRDAVEELCSAVAKLTTKGCTHE
jgi:enamine deaminase RidA (YjgF/YER057c/UK114 family)